MKLRIIDWNVQGRRDVARQMTFLDSLGWDVLLLQEVRPHRLDDFLSWRGVGGGDGALVHRPDRLADRVPWGAAIVVREGIELLTSAPMINVPSPERTLFGVVRAEGVCVEVASLAAPPASTGWNELKAVQCDRFGDRWAARTLPLVVGMDRNSPRTDHPELERCEWFWDAEKRLYGPHPKHDMRDVLRSYLDKHPEQLDAIAKKRPDGPLATSYMRGRGKGDTPGRYDVIYASPEFDVLEVRYPFEASIEAGSDHGLVWTLLDLNVDYLPQAGQSFVPLG